LAEENNNFGDFIEPTEDFLAETDFSAATEETGFKKKPAFKKRASRPRRFRDLDSADSPGRDELDDLEMAGDNGAISGGAGKVEIKPVKFPDLEPTAGAGGLLTSDMFNHIPVQVKVILGSSHINLKDVLEMSEGSLVTLDRLVGENLDLVINDQVIAQGEVVVVDGSYGIKITKIISRK
jgi:flagellar motor switch protein FliN